MTDKITFSDLTRLARFCKGLHSAPDFREVAENILSDETDFEVDNVRFISADVIDETLADELQADSYILGCFNASAIAGATGWPEVLIQAAQKGESFEEIGEAMTREQVEKLAEIYAAADGYGHHFNGYDFEEEEIAIGGATFHVFDNH